MVEYSNILLTMQFNAGLISQNRYAKIINGWKNYVPMARVFDENEEYHFSDSLKPKTGSKRDFFPPIVKLTCNTHEFLAQAERNKVKLELANIVHCGGLGEILADVEKPDPDVKDIITYKESGQKKYLQVADISIVRAINSMQQKSESTWLMKALHSTSKIMRGLLTLWNFDYVIGNIFRDTQDAYIHNKNLDANPFVAAMQMWRAGFKEVVGKKKSQDYIDWLASGGSQSGFITEDVDTAERSIRNLTRSKESLSRKEFLKHPFSTTWEALLRGRDTLYKLAEISEYATRLNTYKTSLAAHKAKRADGKATVEDKQKAALMSRDASIDFAKAGRSGRQINRVLLFSNAALQALSLWGQKIRAAARGEKGAKKNLAVSIFRATTMGVMLSFVRAALLATDDERKKEYAQAPNWEKDTYWIFGGFKIPKGLDLSIRLMSAFTDEALDKMIDDDPVEFERITKAFVDAAPSITATIFTPAVEVLANHSFFRDAPIVPYGEQHLPKKFQYGTETSATAKFFGETSGVSPRNIDYLINGYLGFMGRTAAKIPNFATRGIDWDEMPMVRRFYFNPYKNPKIVTEYYEAYDEQTELIRGYKLERKRGKKIPLPDGFDPALYKRLEAAHETMREISKMEKAILESPKFSYDERKAKIRELEKKRIALCEKVFKRTR